MCQPNGSTSSSGSDALRHLQSLPPQTAAIVFVICCSSVATLKRTRHRLYLLLPIVFVSCSQAPPNRQQRQQQQRCSSSSAAVRWRLVIPQQLAQRNVIQTAVNEIDTFDNPVGSYCREWQRFYDWDLAYTRRQPLETERSDPVRQPNRLRAFAGHLLEWYGSDNLLSYLSAINFYYQNQGYAKPWTGGRCRRLCNAYTTAREARARANGEKGGGLRVQPDGVIRQHAKAEGVSLNLCRSASSAHDQITDWFSPPPRRQRGEPALREHRRPEGGRIPQFPQRTPHRGQRSRQLGHGL